MNTLKEEKAFMSKILVTGGAGFVGSNLCEKLVQMGHSVVSYDNYFTGSENNHVPGVEYIRGSTQDINYLTYFTDQHFDIVFHLGEYSRVEQSFDDFDLVWNYNKLGTFEILKYVKAIGAKLIYAGSSTKFADKDDKYIQSPYAWSKQSNTDFVARYCEWNNIDYAITYFYNVYGKREISTGPYATLIAKYCEHMRLGLPLQVVNPGTQLRNFTHVDDIVEGLILIGENGHGDEYGIGHPSAYSVLDIATLFGGPIEMLPERKGNRMSALVVTEKTRKLGWYSKHNIEIYIDDMRYNGWQHG